MADAFSRGAGRLWAVMGGGGASGEPDCALLDRFVRTRDEAAFGELVRRLGPTVYGVCHRHLGHSDDADDAFQATFLVLVRKAATIQPGRVAAWLCSVASLTARRARLARARRLRRESDPRVSSPVNGTDSDLVPVIDEELGRLPDRYRLPIVLCGLRGLSTAAAADELGWPVGTVASRLSRGRAELARRLATRGIAVGVLATVVGWAELTAAVPTRLLDNTVAMIGGSVSPAVATLTTQVVNVMTWTPIRRLAAGLLAVSAVAVSGGGMLLSLGNAAPVPAQAEVALPAVSAPAPQVLAIRPNKDGKLTLVTYQRQVMEVAPGGGGGVGGLGGAPGGPGGGAAVVGQPVVVPVMTELSAVKDLKVSTAGGKVVEMDEVVKRLARGGVVVVSTDGKAVDAAYLKAFREDMLVLVSPELAPQAMAATAPVGGASGR